jgi:hypothetical protein
VISFIVQIGGVLGSIINAVIIIVFNILYAKLARWLTNWCVFVCVYGAVNPICTNNTGRITAQHHNIKCAYVCMRVVVTICVFFAKDALIFKTFLFQMVNTFASLYYIAFAKRGTNWCVRVIVALVMIAFVCDVCVRCVDITTASSSRQEIGHQ